MGKEEEEEEAKKQKQNDNRYRCTIHIMAIIYRYISINVVQLSARMDLNSENMINESPRKNLICRCNGVYSENGSPIV